MQISTCLIAAIFIGASVLTMLKCDDCPPFTNYEASMTPDQRMIYDKVRKERQNIYLRGLILGLILGVLYLFKIAGSATPVQAVCIFVAVVMSTQYLVYKLHPKQHWMLNYLDTREQIDGWLEVYKHMQHRYLVGAILGIIGYGLLSYGAICP